MLEQKDLNSYAPKVVFSFKAIPNKISITLCVHLCVCDGNMLFKFFW